MADLRCKIVFVGPSKVGKSTLANYIAGVSEKPSKEYRPTAGVRILEFERDVSKPNKKNYEADIKVLVELWDVSGDRQYEACWSACQDSSNGLVVVYNPVSKTASKDVEEWVRWYKDPMGIVDEQVRVFAHSSSAKDGLKSVDPPKNAARIIQCMTNIETCGPEINRYFDELLSDVVPIQLAAREAEERSMMS